MNWEYLEKMKVMTLKESNMKYTKSYWDWNNSQDDLLIKILNNKTKVITLKENRYEKKNKKTIR